MPAVVLYAGPCNRGVLVGVSGLGQLRLHADGVEHLVEPDTAAAEVTDIAVRDHLLAVALAGAVRAAQQHQVAAGKAQQEATDADKAAADQRAAARAQVLRWMHAGQLTEDRVNEYLQQLGMPGYRPTVEVRVQISGKFDIATDDLDAAQSAVEALAVDVSRVSGLVAGSGDWQFKLLEAVRVDPDALGQQP